MIAIRPDTDAGRVLRLLVECPGELRAGDVAEHLWRRPVRQAAPFRDRAEFAAWRAGVAAWDAEHAHKASRLIGRLQEAGLVERMGGVRVAAWFLEDAAARGASAALVRALPSFPSPVSDVSGLVSIVREVEKSPGWRAATSSQERQYARLVAAGVLVAPGQRVATEKGRALVAGWFLLEVA